MCSQVDYEVPSSIAALADLIEYHIDGKRNEFSEFPHSANCEADLLEAMCAFYFPRCEGPNVIMRSMPDCKQRLKCSNPLERLVDAEGICSLNATVPLDSCNALSQYEAYNNFEVCSVVDGSTKVTAWMVEYMNLTDREWTKKLNNGLSSLSSQPAECNRPTLLYYCQFYGHCTTDGEIELINSESDCDGMLSW